MYHPGKVLEVFSHKDRKIKSSDGTTQAMLEMWDENILTFLVDPKIADDIKRGDIVLVDYRPTSTQNPAPRHVIIKILSPEQAKSTWKTYKQFFERRKKLKARVTAPFKPSYVG